MTDPEVPDLTQAQTTNDDDPATSAEFGPASANDTDSDDYDPSINVAENPSPPAQPSTNFPLIADQNVFPSPSYSALHPLPPRPDMLSSTHAGSAGHDPSTSVAPVQPKMKGGFEVDEDDLEAEEDNKDILDVYEPVDGTEGDASVQAPSDLVDSHSPSAKQANGVALTAPPQDAYKSTSTIVPSHLPVTAASPQRAVSVTPLPAATDTPAQVSSTSDNVTNPPAQTISKGRLAHDVVGILKDRIEEDPRGDFEAWVELIEELKSRNKQDDVRKTYEDLLKVFPICAEQWCAYVRWEEQHDHKFQMENIFKRSLLEVANVELWSIYISYIRRRNSMQTGDVTKSYRIINDAFDFALKQVGMDKDSGKLWQEYIDFIKTGPGIIGGSDWQDKSKMDILRSAYQRAIAVPTSSLNSLWKEYDIFETQSNKANGRKNLQERSPSYMTARSAYTQLQNLTKDIVRTSRPRLPPLPGFEGDTEFAYQVNLWQQWIQWERDDNLVLKDEDTAAYRNRVLFTYKQALMALQFWPQMWFDAVEFCFSNGLDNEGVKFLRQGATANPESCLLAFKAADRLESNTTNDESSDPGAKKRLEKVREPFNTLFDSLYKLVEKNRKQESVEIQKVENALAEDVASAETTGGAGTSDENAFVDITARKQEAESQIQSIKFHAQAQLEILKDTLSYAWIALMRAARRIQGKGLPSERGGGFRAIFAEARKRGQITSDVYVESALIEHHCYQDPAGKRIFDRGLKLFPEDARFALAYLKHLLGTNDITNARATFETSVGKLTGNPSTVESARPLFDFMHEYESHFGDLTQIARLEKRMHELYPLESGLRLFTNRYDAPTFDPTTVIPVISMRQIQPKSLTQPSIELQPPAQVPNSPITRLIDSITTNSPKRPFPGDDLEDGPRKIARGESPLKGAAGRRINQQQQQRQANGLTTNAPPQTSLPPPLPNQITYLLSIIPKASTYVDTRFDAGKMVDLLRDTRLPPSISMPPVQPQPAQPSHPPLNWSQQFQPQQQPTMIPPPGYLPGAGMPQSQYTGGPFRYP